ncbi:MAG: GreA/GreB family elongation factor [Alphaproteobacteria bacterium]
MSRAFVKEQDDDRAGDDQPDLPESTHPNYVTPAGLADLKARLYELETERARLGEDPEPPEDKLALAQAERKIRYLSHRIEHAIPIDPAAQPKDEVAFGAIVRVEDEDGAKREYEIVGEDEADVANGKVSWVSPLARALMGAKVGQTVTWKRPAGDAELEVLAIRYRT